MFNLKKMFVMENQSRIEELLSESLKRFDQLSDKMDDVRQDVRSLKEDVTVLKEDVGNLKEDVSGLKGDVRDIKSELIKLNLVSAKNSRSLMILADDHERINRLEKVVYRH